MIRMKAKIWVTQRQMEQFENHVDENWLKPNKAAAVYLEKD